jgi:hypothetical protein
VTSGLGHPSGTHCSRASWRAIFADELHGEDVGASMILVSRITDNYSKIPGTNHPRHSSRSGVGSMCGWRWPAIPLQIRLLGNFLQTMATLRMVQTVSGHPGASYFLCGEVARRGCEGVTEVASAYYGQFCQWLGNPWRGARSACRRREAVRVEIVRYSPANRLLITGKFTRGKSSDN